MRRMLIVAAVLATAATVAAVAAARPVSAKQRVSIEQKGSSFVLTPNSSGAIQPDKGPFAACCWTARYVVVAGERLHINDPHLTLTGARGTLKLRNRS